MKSKKSIIVIILTVDFILLALGALNFGLYTHKAALPAEYKSVINSFSYNVKNISIGEKIVLFEGKKCDKNGSADFYLMNYKVGDSVKITSVNKVGKVIERTVRLENKYNLIELTIIFLVAALYFFTGIYILIKYRENSFAYTIHFLTVCVGLMIILDWGNLITYSAIANFLILFFFVAAMYLAPALFLHMSFTYPVKSKAGSSFFLLPFYCISVTLIIVNTVHLIKIVFLKYDVYSLYFLNFRTTISDIYLAIVLILTIAKFEHSALVLNDITHKKQIYWVLSGITFGPLIYVFLCLVPRILMGTELVSTAFMQFTLIISPVMLLISLSRNKSGSTVRRDSVK